MGWVADGQMSQCPAADYRPDGAVTRLSGLLCCDAPHRRSWGSSLLRGRPCGDDISGTVEPRAYRDPTRGFL